MPSSESNLTARSASTRFPSMTTDPHIRHARIHGAEPETVAAYLPANYKVVGGSKEDGVLIEGIDNAGWTLEGYVLPRLASGLYFGKEEETTNA